jgi:adhesin transport system outer membrane protein
MNARMAQSSNDLATARAAQRSALATLDKLVGDAGVVRDVSPAVSVTAAPAATAALPATACGDGANAESSLRDALAVHPGLQRIERDIDSARAGVDAQRAALRPSLGLRLEQPVAPANDALLRSARVSIVLQYTPDAGLSSVARAQGAGERVAALINQADALKRDVVQQIRAECAEQSGVIERVAGFALARGYTSEVLASSTRLFVAGKRGWLDLLNAAREDFDNEQAGIVAGAALIGSRYRLALLTGERRLALPGVADEPASNLGNTVKAWMK